MNQIHFLSQASDFIHTGRRRGSDDCGCSSSPVGIRINIRLLLEHVSDGVCWVTSEALPGTFVYVAPVSVTYVNVPECVAASSS